MSGVDEKLLAGLLDAARELLDRIEKSKKLEERGE